MGKGRPFRGDYIFVLIRIRRQALYTISCRLREGDTAAASGDGHYMVCVHSPDGDTAVALAEFALSVHKFFLYYHYYCCCYCWHSSYSILLVLDLLLLDCIERGVVDDVVTGGRADVERAEQEQQLLRRVDPEQRQDSRLRHPSTRSQDGRHVHREQHRHPGAVQARLGAVHVHVPPQGFPSLVHWRGHGRDGVHRGRVQHERPRLRVPTVPGRWSRGGGRIRGGV